MVVGLVPPEEEERIFTKLLEYYRKLYQGEKITFKKAGKKLSRKEIAELYYTYPGEEENATSAEKMRMISEAIGHGYDTPLIALQKKNKLIILDGHRRARVALEQGLNWKALIIVPSKDIEFGIEKMVLGKIKELFK